MIATSANNACDWLQIFRLPRSRVKIWWPEQLDLFEWRAIPKPPPDPPKWTIPKCLVDCWSYFWNGGDA